MSQDRMLNTGNVVPFSRTADYMHQRALKNRRENNLLDALELIRRALEKEPVNIDFLMDQAEILCEMGCFMESNALLARILGMEDAPNECYFGLCCNYYGLNDVDSAYRAITYFLNDDPEAVEREEVGEMLENLILARELNVKSGRKNKRAARVAQTGLRQMRAGELERGAKELNRSLEIAPGQDEVRSLYALCLSILDKHEQAILEIEKLTEKRRPTPKTLCIAARIYARSGDDKQAAAQVLRARRMDVEYDGLRLVLNAACELNMHRDVLELSRKALLESPHDRGLLFINAMAHLNENGNVEAARHSLSRIRRLDPDDTVAPHYLRLLETGSWTAPLHYAYQVPDEEKLKRVKEMSAIVADGAARIEAAWREMPSFRQTLMWALFCEDSYLNRVSLNILSLIDGEEQESLLRGFLLRPEANDKLRQMATILLSMKRARQPYLTMTEKGLAFVNVGEAEEPMHLPLPYRRVLSIAIRAAGPMYADDLNEKMTRRWMNLVHKRGQLLKIKNPDAWAAGLLLSCVRDDPGYKRTATGVPRLFGATERAAIRCAKLIDEA